MGIGHRNRSSRVVSTGIATGEKQVDRSNPKTVVDDSTYFETKHCPSERLRLGNDAVEESRDSSGDESMETYFARAEESRLDSDCPWDDPDALPIENISRERLLSSPACGESSYEDCFETEMDAIYIVKDGGEKWRCLVDEDLGRLYYWARRNYYSPAQKRMGEGMLTKGKRKIARWLEENWNEWLSDSSTLERGLKENWRKGTTVTKIKQGEFCERVEKSNSGGNNEILKSSGSNSEVLKWLYLVWDLEAVLLKDLLH